MHTTAFRPENVVHPSGIRVDLEPTATGAGAISNADFVPALAKALAQHCGT
jgi:hypothetical protein